MIKNLNIMNNTGNGWWNICFQKEGEYFLWWCSSVIEEYGCKVYDINPDTDENEELLSDHDEDQKHTVRELSQQEALDVLKEIYPIIAEINGLIAKEITQHRI